MKKFYFALKSFFSYTEFFFNNDISFWHILTHVLLFNAVFPSGDGLIHSKDAKQPNSMTNR